MRRRRLAAELRRLRREAGLSIEDAVGQLGWPSSKLSRIENRQIGIKTTDLRKLLTLYGVNDQAQQQALLDMARRAGERGWWQAYGDVMPSEYSNYVGLEAEASEIRTYQPELVYGLLQTEAYARAVIRAFRPNDTAEEIDRRVEVRLARQQILTGDNPPRVRVVLNEAVIRRQVGGPGVMREQLHYLASERDRGNVIVQIMPFTAGEHPAMTGPFVIVDFPEPTDLGVVVVENMSSALSLEKPEDLSRYGMAFDYLSAAALGPKESRDMLTALAEELS
jgi:transcriptional regulator with XRE-family HTH domain